MKHNRFPVILLLSLLSFLSCNLLHTAKIQLKGIIEGVSSLSKIPSFALHFAGKQTYSNDDGLYSFSLDNKITIKSILFCEKIIPLGKKNTLEGWCIASNEPYKYYSFDVDPKKNNQWKEHKLPPGTIAQNNEKFIKIPEYTIVVFMNPAIVSHVEQWELEKSPHYCEAPKIIIKNGDIETIKLSSAKSLALAPDVACYFAQDSPPIYLLENQPKA